MNIYDAVFINQACSCVVRMPSRAAWRVRQPGGAGSRGVRGSGKRPAPSEKAYRDIYIPTQNYFSSPLQKWRWGL